MNKHRIPKGMYCYDHNGTCPYWSEDKSLPEQENGYCYYLKQSDWDINEEVNNKNGVEVLDCKTNTKFKADAHDYSCSLLWDMVKECGINE